MGDFEGMNEIPIDKLIELCHSHFDKTGEYPDGETLECYGKRYRVNLLMEPRYDFLEFEEEAE